MFPTVHRSAILSQQTAIWSVIILKCTENGTCRPPVVTTANLPDFVLTFLVLKTNELNHNTSSSIIQHHWSIIPLKSMPPTSQAGDMRPQKHLDNS